MTRDARDLLTALGIELSAYPVFCHRWVSWFILSSYYTMPYPMAYPFINHSWRTSQHGVKGQKGFWLFVGQRVLGCRSGVINARRADLREKLEDATRMGPKKIGADDFGSILPVYHHPTYPILSGKADLRNHNWDVELLVGGCCCLDWDCQGILAIGISSYMKLTLWLIGLQCGIPQLIKHSEEKTRLVLWREGYLRSRSGSIVDSLEELAVGSSISSLCR